MILRRVVEHVKAQNWLAVALDFVIVVVGVFIGIQVSNWNAARIERGLETGYLERLREDFSRSIANADSNIERMERQFRLEGVMLDHLSACRLDAEDRAMFDLGMYLVGRLEPPPLARETIDELQSTGRLTIIRNPEIRRDLADVIGKQKINAEVLDYIIARATPQVVYIDSRVVIDQPTDGFAGVFESGLPEGVANYDFPALCQDRRYHAAVSTLREVTRVVIGHNRDRKADYERMIALLDDALERRAR